MKIVLSQNGVIMPLSEGSLSALLSILLLDYVSSVIISCQIWCIFMGLLVLKLWKSHMAAHFTL